MSLQVQASDPDGDNLNWNATGLPAGLSINGQGRITGTVQQDAHDDSPYTVSVSVSDGEETRGVQFEWTIYDDVPPVVAFTSPAASSRTR